MEKTLSTVKKLSNAISIISKIVRVFLIIGFVFTVLGSIIFLAMPKDFFSIEIISKADVKTVMNIDQDLRTEIDPSMIKSPEIDFEIGENFIRFSFNNSEFSLNNYHFGVIMWCYAIEIAAMYVVLLFVGKLFKNISESRTPFTSKTYELIKQLGITLIIYATVPGLMSEILLSIMKIKGNMFAVGHDLSLSTVIIVLAYIAGMFLFKYVLQKENTAVPDENKGTDF